jgi:hypothetical protein
METDRQSCHIRPMASDHQFSIRIERDTSRPGLYRWALFKGTQAYNRSEISFTTKREAAEAGAKVLEKRVAAWLALK